MLQDVNCCYCYKADEGRTQRHDGAHGKNVVMEDPSHEIASRGKDSDKNCACVNRYDEIFHFLSPDEAVLQRYLGPEAIHHRWISCVFH